MCSLNEDGELDSSLGIVINNDDEEVIWYEVGDLVNTSCLDTDGKTRLHFMEIPTLAETKRRIDLCLKQDPIED